MLQVCLRPLGLWLCLNPSIPFHHCPHSLSSLPLALPRSTKPYSTRLHLNKPATLPLTSRLTVSPRVFVPSVLPGFLPLLAPPQLIGLLAPPSIGSAVGLRPNGSALGHCLASLSVLSSLAPPSIIYFLAPPSSVSSLVLPSAGSPMDSFSTVVSVYVLFTFTLFSCVLFLFPLFPMFLLFFLLSRLLIMLHTWFWLSLSLKD